MEKCFKLLQNTHLNQATKLYSTMFKPSKREYRKVPKFSDARKLCCKLPKMKTKRPNLRVFHQKDANGTANSEDPDQTAPRGPRGAV